jgi:hypothetical protein
MMTMKTKLQIPDAGCQMPDARAAASRLALTAFPSGIRYLVSGILAVALLILPASGADVRFNLRSWTATGLNRKLTLTPDNTLLVAGTNLHAGATVVLYPTNGVAWASNLVANDYTLQIEGLNLPSTILRVPDTEAVIEATSIITNAPTYTYTNHLGQISWRLQPGAGYTVTTNNAGQWNEYLTLTVAGAGGTATNAPDVKAGSGITISSNSYERTLSAQFTNRYTLPLFTDGILFTNGASGQRSRLQYYEFLGAARLWLSNGVFEASYLEGNGSALTALNAGNIASGNLDVARLNGGSGASASTYWRGDGTWATPAGGSSGVPTLNGSATNLTLRGDTAIYAGADTVIQATTDSPGELYGFGAWSVSQIASTNFVGNGGNLTNLPSQTNDYKVRGIIAGSGMTGSTNLSTGVVTLTSSGGAAHYGPFTNTTTWGNGSLTNSMTVTPTNVFFTHSAGGWLSVSNGDIASSGQIKTPALITPTIIYADATNRFVISASNSFWQSLTLTGTVTYIALASEAATTNAGSTIRLSVYGSNSVTWTTSNLSNSAAGTLGLWGAELLFDRRPNTNLWTLTRYQ